MPELTVAEVAGLAGLSRPSVYKVQSEFPGLLVPKLWLNPSIGYAVGVDLGPRHARVALSDLNGQLFEHRPSFETFFSLNQPPKDYLDWTARAITKLLSAAQVDSTQVIGIGVSQVAPIHLKTGRPHPSGLTNKAWRDVDVGGQLEQRLQWGSVATAIDNDTNLSALTERVFGSARDLDSFLYVNWSNYIGFGLFLAGEPYRGTQGYAGELGHWIIGAGGSKCPRCGKPGCLEMQIGASPLAHAIAAALGRDFPAELHPHAADFVLDLLEPEPRPDPDLDPDHAPELDPKLFPVRVKVTSAVEGLARSVALIVDMLDPGAVILGGSLGSRLHDDTALLATFRDELERRMMGFAQGITIGQARRRTRSAVHGATLRVLENELVPWARRTFHAKPDDASSGPAGTEEETVAPAA